MTRCRIFILLFCFQATAYAQQLYVPAIVHHQYAFVNPSFYGFQEKSNLSLSYRKTMAGIPNSPEYFSGNFDMRFRNGKYGLGLNAHSADLGPLRRTLVSAGYGYRLKINDKNRLGFGISAGVEQTRIDFSRINAQDPTELMLSQSSQNNSLGVFNVGVMYNLARWEIGLNSQFYSGSRLVYKNPTTGEGLAINKVPSYSLVTRLPIRLSNRWTYVPSVALYSTQGLPFYADIFNEFRVKEQFRFGVGFRQSQALYGQIGYVFSDQLHVAYTFQKSFNQTFTPYSNSHEVIVRFALFSNRSEGSSQVSQLKTSESRVLQEQLDNDAARIKELNRRLDSLESSMSYQKKEIEALRSEQVSQDDIRKIISSGDGAPTNVRPTDYEILNADSEKALEGTAAEANTTYYIVLGVFRNIERSRELKKVLKRDTGIETKLVEMERSGDKMYLITLPEDYKSPKKAYQDLVAFRKNKQGKYSAYLNGEPWILKMKK